MGGIGSGGKRVYADGETYYSRNKETILAKLREDYKNDVNGCRTKMLARKKEHAAKPEVKERRKLYNSSEAAKLSVKIRRNKRLESPTTREKRYLYTKEYYARNKEKIQAYFNEYRKRTEVRERESKQKKIWYEKNRESIKAYASSQLVKDRNNARFKKCVELLSDTYIKGKIANKFGIKYVDVSDELSSIVQS